MPSTRAPATAPPPAAIDYPFSDGKMIAELPKHGDAILYALATLRNWFARHDRVQVGASIFLYYQEGDNTKRVTLDLFVARGLEAMPEYSYKLWEAGRPPTLVLEAASHPTEDGDWREKRDLYALIGVKEYWRFHPTGSLKGAKRPGTRLEGGTLQELEYKPLLARTDGSIRSEVLGLDVRVDERPGSSHLLRFRDPKTGQDLLTFEEVEQRRQAAERGRQAAERGRQAAERGRHKAERARQEAERAYRAETAARQDIEAEIARLRAQITRLESGQAGRTGDDS